MIRDSGLGVSLGRKKNTQESSGESRQDTNLISKPSGTRVSGENTALAWEVAGKIVSLGDGLLAQESEEHSEEVDTSDFPDVGFQGLGRSRRQGQNKEYLELYGNESAYFSTSFQHYTGGPNQLKKTRGKKRWGKK